MTAYDQYKQDFALLIEAGFIAVNQADEDAAVRLFKASALLRPTSLLPKIGYGYLHLLKLELKQACLNFEDVLQQEPTNDMAKALLGLCMSLQPKSIDQGSHILEETLQSDNSLVKQMSHTALEFVDKFVRKAPAPLHGSSAEKPKKSAKKNPKAKKNHNPE